MIEQVRLRLRGLPTSSSSSETGWRHWVLGGVINTAGPASETGRSSPGLSEKAVGVVRCVAAQLSHGQQGLPFLKHRIEFFVVAADPAKCWPFVPDHADLVVDESGTECVGSYNERKRSALRQPGMLVGKAETPQ